MAVSYNKLPRERVWYVADSLERKHFGEAHLFSKETVESKLTQILK
jgi:hypothetical protein